VSCDSPGPPRFRGQLRLAWRFGEPADPQAEGAVERLLGYAETTHPPDASAARRVDHDADADETASMN
jgi:hypothetical protein